MHTSARRAAFTLIELLTVIAIISILTAIIFPIAATVREQSRATSCMTKMHQLWVGATVYKQDEGAYPRYLLGLYEPGIPADRVMDASLYGEQIKDISTFRCPDNMFLDPTASVMAEYGARPASWPVSQPWYTDVQPSNPAPYYAMDSYDIGPRLNADGSVAKDGNGVVIYDIHYSLDWTGKPGATDLPNQLQYANPPEDKTMLTYCTWHTAVAHSPSIPVIMLSGTAKKVSLNEFLQYGPNLFNR